MIALMMMGAVALYIAFLFIALWLLPKVIKIRHIKRIIFVVWFLIPTWDVIIGYPIYKFLCATQAGVKIYKTVDNVEGFYVGEWSKDGYRKVPPLPYQGYKFLDYKEIEKNKHTGKYFRTSWVDVNTTQECIQIGSFDKDRYFDVINQGKCIVKEEIDEREVSRWYFNSNNIVGSYLGGLTAPIIIPILNFTHQIPLLIQDTKNGQTLGQLDYYWWSGGWLFRRFSSFSSGSGGVDCGFKEEDEHPATTFVNTILKPKQGTSDGNN